MNENAHDNVPVEQPAQQTNPPVPAAPPPGEPVDARQLCSECGGNGWIMLFVKRRACDKCGGKGRLDAAPATPPIAAADPERSQPERPRTEPPENAGARITSERGPLVRGAETHIYEYGDPTPCPECGGRGRVALFTTDKPCGACEGWGKIWPKARHEVIPGVVGYLRTERRFDELGRVISICEWIEPANEKWTAH